MHRDKTWLAITRIASIAEAGFIVLFLATLSLALRADLSTATTETKIAFAFLVLVELSIVFVGALFIGVLRCLHQIGMSIALLAENMSVLTERTGYVHRG